MTDNLPIEDQLLSPSNFDYEKYRHHLKGHGFTAEQENQIMDLMWESTRICAEKAWGFSPTQDIKNQDIENSLRHGKEPLDSKSSFLKDTFENKVSPPTSERLQ